MSMLITILTAFASGVLGACLGAMPAVIMCGVAVVLGMIGAVSGSGFDWLTGMAFGMFVGPQVSFAPACVAAAYAKSKGYIESSKDIFLPLVSLKKPDVLIVSGIFAIVGWYTNVGIASVLSGKDDSVALTIVIVSMLGRVIFQGNGLRGVIGIVPKGKKRFDPRTSDAWIPYQTNNNSLQMSLLGLCVGCISGYITTTICEQAVATGNDSLYAVAAMPVWGIAIVWCLVMAAGCNVPVAHHIGLVAGYAAKMAFLNGQSSEMCVFWGLAFGLAAVYTGDILGKLLTVYGEGYVDPPSMAIAFWSIFLLWLIPDAGLMSPESSGSVILPVAILIICGAIAVHDSLIMNRSEKNNNTVLVEEMMEE